MNYFQTGFIKYSKKCFTIFAISVFAIFGKMSFGSNINLESTININKSGDKTHYLLQVRDLIKISVYGQDDLTIEQHIDQDGLVQIPLIGATQVGGLSVRNAEKFVATKFIEDEYLRNPQVAISILEYTPREVSIFGQVKNPGQILFPPEFRFLDIQEVISRAGDFTNVAKSDEVRITRKNENGAEQVFLCNVEKIITGKSKNKKDNEGFKIYPGDVIYVPERFF